MNKVTASDKWLKTYAKLIARSKDGNFKSFELISRFKKKNYIIDIQIFKPDQYCITIYNRKTNSISDYHMLLDRKKSMNILWEFIKKPYTVYNINIVDLM